MKSLCISALLLFFGANVLAQAPAIAPTPNPPSVIEPPIELDTIMMETTFLLEGPTAQGNSLGTAFVIGVPIPNTTPLGGALVLVTAAHVLEEIPGDFAVLHLRRKVDGETNTWVPAPFRLQIRSNGQPLWKKHPHADVAAMSISIPADTPIKPITTNMFITDEELAKYAINPGDEVRCLGYPMGLASNVAGFPVLRSGKIASYPLTPTAATQTFLVDLRVFKGNSGGPVFLVENNRPLLTTLGQYLNLHFIVGLVSEERIFNETMVGQYSQEAHQTQLGLAVVIHASLMKQTIEMLPPPQAQ
jgi:S1-C subfamily serine protease